MKIKVKREGGFMGIPAKADFSLDELSSDERSAFEDMVLKSVETPESYQKRDMPSPDAFAYEIKFKKGTKNMVLKFDDSSIPEKVYLLLEKYLPKY
jgi:hypothetical protein